MRKAKRQRRLHRWFFKGELAKVFSMDFSPFSAWKTWVQVDIPCAQSLLQSKLPIFLFFCIHLKTIKAQDNSFVSQKTFKNASERTYCAAQCVALLLKGGCGHLPCSLFHLLLGWYPNTKGLLIVFLIYFFNQRVMCIWFPGIDFKHSHQPLQRCWAQVNW